MTIYMKASFLSKPPVIGRRAALNALAWVAGSAGFGLAVGAYKFQIGQHPVVEPGPVGPERVALLSERTCSAPSSPTPWVSEGPFYAPNSPLRADLRAGGRGNQIRVVGRVTDGACRPIAGAVLDFWQTDPQGLYDHFGYAFRGHQFTDREGRYELLTLLPASYKFMGVWRRRHIHVKVAAPGRRLLTSQIFFPFGVDARVEDFSFDPKLVSAVEAREDALLSLRFDFALEGA